MAQEQRGFQSKWSQNQLKPKNVFHWSDVLIYTIIIAVVIGFIGWLGTLGLDVAALPKGFLLLIPNYLIWVQANPMDRLWTLPIVPTIIALWAFWKFGMSHHQ